jgi:hypothetical protein
MTQNKTRATGKRLGARCTSFAAHGSFLKFAGVELVRWLPQTANQLKTQTANTLSKAHPG